MTSVLNVDTIADKAGTGPATLTKQHAAKAWANIDESGTPSIRDSFNVSGITDHATGDFSHAFTSAFANVNHASSAASNATLGANYNRNTSFLEALSASSIRHKSSSANDNGVEDQEAVMVITFGDLA